MNGTAVFDYLTDLAATVASDVLRTLTHNWPYLLASVVIASLVQVFLSTELLGAWLRKRVWVAVVAAVGLGALTPFCSCGTTAVVLGAMASSVPWAPIVAFMVSSPLTSPEQYVMSLGLFGHTFTNAYVAASVVAGLAGGTAAWLLERKGLLRGQQRMRVPAQQAPEGCCGSTQAEPTQPRQLLPLSDVTGAHSPAAPAPSRWRLFLTALVRNARTLAVYFLGFATLGYLLIRIIPTEALTEALGEGNPVWSVPLAALLGIPVYLNSDGSLPLVASLMEGGMSSGAGLAFLITGAGTSVGAISGMLVIARWRIVALVVGTLMTSALLAGWLLELWQP